MWIVKIALHRPYTFIVLALLTGAHLPIVNRNACEGKCDCVEVCPYDVFQVRRIEDEDFLPGKTEKPRSWPAIRLHITGESLPGMWTVRGGLPGKGNQLDSEYQLTRNPKVTTVPLRKRFPMPNRSSQSPIKDARIRAVINRLVETQGRPPSGGPHNDPAASLDPYDYPEYGFSIVPEQGELIYLLCRSICAKRVVDFATSVGLSALYFAAAIRDNGGGTVIGSELVPAKIATAKSNLADAGLSAYVEIREGDARVTLSNLGGAVDFVLIDGWPVSQEPSLAREVIQVVAPQIRIGGYVVNDNSEPDFLEFIRDSANGFISVNLPLKSGTELCVKVS